MGTEIQPVTTAELFRKCEKEEREAVKSFERKRKGENPGKTDEHPYMGRDQTRG